MTYGAENGGGLSFERGRISVVLRAQEADHCPRRVQHLPAGGRGSAARPSRRRERGRRRPPRSRPWRECPRLCCA
jgi:hypothetical protein